MGTPPVAGPRASTASVEPLWGYAFPVYHSFTFGYGVFAAVFYLPQLRAAAQNDPTAAQAFGVLVAVASFCALAGAVRTLRRRRDGLELFGSAFFALMMVAYFLTLTYLVGAGDPGTRPGSTFVPICMGVFPAFRWGVILRDRRRRRAQAAAS